jgi:hypothetical protein
MKTAPDTVDTDAARSLYNLINIARTEIKNTARETKHLATIAKSRDSETASREDRGETIANLMLAYRHLEDASMRLGKALQAIDGGASVYDPATTVGAPAATT